MSCTASNPPEQSKEQGQRPVHVFKAICDPWQGQGGVWRTSTRAIASKPTSDGYSCEANLGPRSIKFPDARRRKSKGGRGHTIPPPRAIARYPRGSKLAPRGVLRPRTQQDWDGGAEGHSAPQPFTSEASGVSKGPR